MDLGLVADLVAGIIKHPRGLVFITRSGLDPPEETCRLQDHIGWRVASGTVSGPVQVTSCLMNPGNCRQDESRWAPLLPRKRIPKPLIYLHALLPSLCGGRKLQDKYKNYVPTKTNHSALLVSSHAPYPTNATPVVKPCPIDLPCFPNHHEYQTNSSRKPPIPVNC